MPLKMPDKLVASTFEDFYRIKFTKDAKLKKAEMEYGMDTQSTILLYLDVKSDKINSFIEEYKKILIIKIKKITTKVFLITFI